MAEIFTVEIITPEGIFYIGEADFLEFNTVAGQIGVYKDHIPTTTVLASGMVIIHNGDTVKFAAVQGGFVEILNDKVMLLAEVAEWPDEMDIFRAESRLAGR